MTSKFLWVAGRDLALCFAGGLVLGLVLSTPVRADALSTLTDAEVFKKAQKEIAAMPHADLDALNEAVATCAAVTIGQRAQSFECERSINSYWTRYSRGRAIDSYMASLAGLFAGFDNNAMNPTDAMMATYKRASGDLVTLQKTLNERYRALDKG